MKNDTQKSPHIRKTVAEMDEDIQKLNDDLGRLMRARSTLVELYGGETDVPEPAAPQTSVLPSRKKPQKAAKPEGEQTAGESAGQAAPTADAGFTRAPSGDTVKLLAIIRSAPEPFSAKSLVVRSVTSETRSPPAYNNSKMARSRNSVARA